jgi:hypothetical protein
MIGDLQHLQRHNDIGKTKIDMAALAGAMAAMQRTNDGKGGK